MYTDDRFTNFIEKKEKLFKKMGINSEDDLDTLSEENEQKIEKVIDEFTSLFNVVWNDFGSKETTDSCWDNSISKSEYKYIFEIMK